MSEVMIEPCPFCGESITTVRHLREPDCYYLQCIMCDARNGYHDTEPEAITAWNRVARLSRALDRSIYHNVKATFYECGKKHPSYECPVPNPSEIGCTPKKPVSEPQCNACLRAHYVERAGAVSEDPQADGSQSPSTPPGQ